jgi:hypothetical protein
MSTLIQSYRTAYIGVEQEESSPFGILGVFAMLVCVINCVLPEFEMLVLGGRVPIPQAIIKVGCFTFLGVLMVIYGKFDLTGFPTTIWVATVLYLVLDFPFIWFIQRKEPGEALLAYNAYYCPLIFAPIVTVLRGKVSPRAALLILLGTLAASSTLGWAQFIMQDPIVKLASADGNFRIFASQWMQGGERSTRAMSFFGNAQEFGSFLVLVACIGIGMCRERGGWRKGITVFLFASATCYTTLTRAAFVQLGMASVAALIFTFGKKPSRMLWQPILALVLGLLIAFSGYSKKISNQISDKKSLADDSSLQQRLMQWGIYTSQLQHSTTTQQLFGLGFCQADAPAMIPLKEEWNLVLVDNLYLALVLHIGLVGAALMLGLLWAMWTFIRHEAIQHPTPVMIGIASFWSTVLMTGMFNIQAANYGFWFLIAVILSRRTCLIEQRITQPELAEAVS